MVVRSVMVYGLETAAMANIQERQREIGEIRLLKFYLGVKLKERQD